MVAVVLEISEGRPSMQYLWAKTVVGFDPSTHCMACLLGERLDKVRLSLVTGGKVKMDLPEGRLVYLCGVATPYVWKNNFHLPFRVKAGSECGGKFYSGQKVRVLNAEYVEFTDQVAREKYLEKGPKFFTCRNFQFAAQMFPNAEERLRAPRSTRKKAATGPRAKPTPFVTDGPIRYPQVQVELIGESADPSMILAKILTAMRKAGVSEDDVQSFRAEARSAGLARLVSTARSWVTII